jgi:hypothetical protein
MPTRRTTTPTERVDLLLGQAEQFFALDLVGEGRERLRHALAQCAKEDAEAADESTRAEIATRRTYAEHALRKLDEVPVPSRPEHAIL